jgi:hypothetical protein
LQFDSTASLYQSRLRDYGPALGRFMQQDRGYWDGLDLYQDVLSNPIVFVDPIGLDSTTLPSGNPPTRPTLMPTSGCGSEPVYNPTLWNDNGRIQHSNNCYSYACNDPNNHPDGTKPQPGEHSGHPYYGVPWAPNPDPNTGKFNPGPVAGAAQNDGLTPTDCDKPCPCGSYKVALVYTASTTDPNNQDYHWYRQDSDGTWSGKPGPGQATNLDASGNIITDPRTADRNYGGLNYDGFFGCFCVPKNGITTGPKQ